MILVDDGDEIDDCRTPACRSRTRGARAVLPGRLGGARRRASLAGPAAEGAHLPDRAAGDVPRRPAGCTAGSFPFELSEPLVVLGAVANIGAGAPWLVARMLDAGAGTVTAATYEYGNSFLIVAGLLNFLVILDAFDIGDGAQVTQPFPARGALRVLRLARLRRAAARRAARAAAHGRDDVRRVRRRRVRARLADVSAAAVTRAGRAGPSASRVLPGPALPCPDPPRFGTRGSGDRSSSRWPSSSSRRRSPTSAGCRAACPTGSGHWHRLRDARRAAAARARGRTAERRDRGGARSRRFVLATLYGVSDEVRISAFVPGRTPDRVRRARGLSSAPRSRWRPAWRRLAHVAGVYSNPSGSVRRQPDQDSPLDGGQ